MKSNDDDDTRKHLLASCSAFPPGFDEINAHMLATCLLSKDHMALSNFGQLIDA